ncbi:discoidin domain-containing protein [Cohnella fermenti]|uniref:F5/8 type C domain-containing protein n=1 Tax=Cohnella fermenti TaxID=2565925 RepID=A0A4S4BGF3_9BACL|nr:discoidin domain-containing protein [Cohnella fermenti]THF72829.1 hypothetical protein E6C55_31650 [Cohnella fermenti]
MASRIGKSFGWLAGLIAAIIYLFVVPAAAQGTYDAAYGKQTSATSEYSASYVSGLAVDGSNGTLWVSNRSAQTDPGIIFWQVDLGDEHVLEELQLRFRSNDYEQKNFEILASNTSDFASYSTLHTQGDTAVGIQTSIPVTDQTAYRYLRFNRLPAPGSTTLQNAAIAEFKAFGSIQASSEAELVGIVAPAGAVVSEGTVMAAVYAWTDTLTVDVEISDSASWKLYADAATSHEIVNKVWKLQTGSNQAYIKLTAQDGVTTNVYPIAVTRPADLSGDAVVLTNAALGKPTEATSVYSASTPSGYAVDGSNGTIWASNRSVQSVQDTVYWQVDLEESQVLEQIVLRLRANDWEQKNFELLASNTADFGVYTVLYTQGDAAIGQQATIGITDESAYRYVRFNRLEAPTVGLLQNAAIAELKAMTFETVPQIPEGTAGSREISDENNLALNKPAKGSSYFGNDDSYKYVNAVDGDNGTYWISWRSAGDNDAYWQVDLAAHYTLSRIELEGRRDADMESQRSNFEILASDKPDFSEYTVLGRGTNAFPYQGVWTLPIDDSASYRYLRYHKTASGETGVVAEFRVTGVLDTTKTPNEVPSAVSVAVYGTAAIGDTITGVYTYSDPDGDAEGGTRMRWLLGDEGAFRPIAGQTAAQLELDRDAYAGMYVKFEVTPADAAGQTGDAVQSPAVLISPRVGQYLESVGLGSEAASLAVGDIGILSVSGTHHNGRAADMTMALTRFESSDPEVVAVSPDGVVSAVGAGQAEVTAIAELEGVTITSDPVTFNVYAPAVQAAYYVDAANGDDAGDGTLLDPFRTIQRAQAEVRLVNGNMTGTIAVYLRGGLYELSESLSFEGSDSGTNGYNIVYRNYGEEEPVISGGRRVGNWSLYDAGRNIYKAVLDEPIATRQLFVNGQRAVRARSEGGLPDVVQTATGYTTSMTALAGWSGIENMELVFIEDFTNPRNAIASVQVDQGIAAITMQEPGWTYNRNKGGTQPKLPVYIENAYELLDEPGEWYLAPDGYALYYMPRAGEDMAAAIVEVPLLEQLVQLEGTLSEPVHNIRFEGLEFTLATWLAPGTSIGHPDAQSNILRYGQSGLYRNEVFSGAAVNMRMAHSIVFDRTVFTRLGGAGINMFEGSRDNRISGSVFTDISASGIQIGEPNRNNFYTMNPEDSRYVVRNNVVRTNYIARIGVDYKSSVGIFGGYTDGLHIAHNEISDVPYSGITLGWGWSNELTVARNNRIVNNYVHDVMQELHDGSAIYTLSAQPDSVIAGNYVDTGTNPGGIYLDQGSSYFHVHRNVIRNVSQWLKITSSNNIENTIQLNYIDNTVYSDAGVNNIIDRNTLFPANVMPTEAEEIVQRAGIEGASQ